MKSEGIGQYHSLEVLREVDFGVYLDGGEIGEILLPGRYVPDGVEAGDFLDVFLYLDSEDRLIATTEKPYATVGEFACLRAVAVNQTGAFLDWGLGKDLLVPYREQREPMYSGRSYVVYIYLDVSSHRIVASTKLRKFLSPEKPS